MKQLGIFLFAMLLLAGFAGAADLVINEFMASNLSTLQDEDGDHSDWIEIYNAGTVTVDLAGWHLTDASDNLDKWTFPATNIASGGFLLVFASDKDRAAAGSELHANFKLSASGEYLGLVMPDGYTVVSEYSPAFPAQYSDVSYGYAAVAATTLWLAADAACRWHVPADGSLGSNWTERLFDDSAWSSGTMGVGYATDPDTNYLDLIGTDVSNAMFGVYPGVYLRLAFDVADASRFSGAKLLMKYDDGFFAWLNGVDLAHRYSPATSAWDAVATNFHPDEEAVVYEVINLPDGEDQLVTGTNVLAIHGMNNTLTSSDLLFVTELMGLGAGPEPTMEKRYFSVPTPGEGNGTGSSDLGPLIFDVAHAPAAPAAGQDLLVTTRIETGAAAVASAVLYYRAMFSNEVAAALLDNGLQDDGTAGNRIYGAVIPSSAYTTGQMVRYRIEAVDVAAVTSRWPLAGDAAEYEGTVVADPALTNALPVLHWFVEDPDWHVEPWGNNEDWSPACVYYMGVFYDNVQMRVRGGTAAGWTNPPFKVEFNSGRRFLYATNMPLAEEININTFHGDKAFMRATLAHETYGTAGAPCSTAFPVRVQENGAFYGVAVFVEQVDERFVERHGIDPVGPLYKMYNLMTSSTVLVEKRMQKDEPNDDLQALVDGVNWTNSLAARTTYTFDHVDIAQMINYLAATVVIHDRDSFFKNYYVYLDVDESGLWLMFPWDKDLTYGRNWTNDFGVLNDQIAFWDSPIIPESTYNRLTGILTDSPRIRAMFGRRLRSVMDATLQPPGTPGSNLLYEARVNELKSLMAPDLELHRARWGNPYGANQTPAQAMAILTNQYLAPRRHHLYVTNHVSHGGIIPDAQTNSPRVEFGTVECAPASGNQDQEYIELVNTNAAAVDISGWSLSNAVEFTFQPGVVIEAGGSLYVSPDQVSFRARTNSPKAGEDRFVQGNYDGHLSSWGETIELYDADGALVNSTNYTGAPSDLQRYLRITEVMYHPRNPPFGPYENADLEYIEFKNIATNVSLDVSGVYFGSGFTFFFTNEVTSLDPGEMLVLVRNREAFASRYDTNGIRIAGGYAGRLDNSGEELKIEDPNSETILDFLYGNLWYTNTDGYGYSLTIWDACGDRAAWDLSNGWRSSIVFDGTPGWDDSDLVDYDGDGLPDLWEIRNFGTTNHAQGGPGDDFDGDGSPNEVEYAAGTSASNGLERFEVGLSPSNGSVLVHYYSRSASGIGYTRKTRAYSLESAVQLAPDTWALIPDHTNMPGLDQVVVHTNAASSRDHFRLRATLQ